jgi:uncharacterized membrane protein (DUF485 family)
MRHAGLDAGDRTRQTGYSEERRLAELGKDDLVMRIAADPRYEALVRRRVRFTWVLTGIMLAIFFGYILLIAFDKALLAQPIGGGTTTLGIPIGIGVILAGIILTGVYVRRANRDFDAAVKAIREDANLDKGRP